MLFHKQFSKYFQELEIMLSIFPYYIPTDTEINLKIN